MALVVIVTRKYMTLFSMDVPLELHDLINVLWEEDFSSQCEQLQGATKPRDVLSQGKVNSKPVQNNSVTWAHAFFALEQ